MVIMFIHLGRVNLLSLLSHIASQTDTGGTLLVEHIFQRMQMIAWPSSYWVVQS